MRWCSQTPSLKPPLRLWLAQPSVRQASGAWPSLQPCLWAAQPSEAPASLAWNNLPVAALLGPGRLGDVGRA